MRSSEPDVGTRTSKIALPAIDGVTASSIVIPGDAQAAADVLAEARSQGQAVAPVGGGTALGLGNLPERVDVALSTKHFGGIIDYEPTDLVLSVGAGARFGDVQAILGEHGQRLPLDPPGGADATIGGLIATGRWGPLRHSAGTLRDLLIGIAVAHPSGAVSRAGGMVVKNVSGYDMARLYLGSLGTLGVIVSANFKVLPRPRSEATIIAGFTAPQEAFAQASRLRQSLEPVAALEVARLDGRWLLAARLEGRDAAVSAAASRIMSAITSADVTRIDTDASMEWWRHHVAQQALPTADHTAIVRCGGRPKETSTLTAGIMAALDDLGGSVPYLAASPGLGAVVAQVAFGPAGSGEILAALQMRLLGLAETATILAAPPDWKRGIDVWGRLPEGFDVMRSLREQFDPQRTINPGRFAGFL